MPSTPANTESAARGRLSAAQAMQRELGGTFAEAWQEVGPLLNERHSGTGGKILNRANGEPVNFPELEAVVRLESRRRRGGYDAARGAIAARVVELARISNRVPASLATLRQPVLDDLLAEASDYETAAREFAEASLQARVPGARLSVESPRQIAFTLENLRRETARGSSFADAWENFRVLDPLNFAEFVFLIRDQEATPA